MDITFFSDDLYANLIGYPELNGLRDQSTDREKTLNGLILLRHYHTLKTHVDAFRSETLHQQTTQSLLLELELLVDGLLADGEVFKSFGYENLYENKFIDFKLWKKFQQDSFEKDVSSLEEGFYEVDEDLDELSTHLSDQGSSEHAQAESVVDGADIFADLPMFPDSVDIQRSNAMSVDEITDVGGLTIPAVQESAPCPYSEPGQKPRCSPTQDEVGVPLPPDEVALVNGDRLFDRTLNPLLAEAIEAGHGTIVHLPLDQDASWFLDTILRTGARVAQETLEGSFIDGGVGDMFFGENLLAKAAEAGYETVVRLLQDGGASVNSDGSFGNAPLAKVTEAGHRTIVKLPSWFLDAILQLAAGAGHDILVPLLLDRGASVNSRGPFEDAPLAKAAEAGHGTIVRLLLDRGASVIGSFGNAPLAKAAGAGHETIVRLLLDRGASVNDGGILGNAPLANAAEAGHETIVRLLLDRGASVNGDGSLGNVPLVNAAKAGHETIVRLLLDRGASVNGDGSFGNAPLAIVADARHVTKVKRSPNFPLAKAAEAGYKAIFRLLFIREAAIPHTPGYMEMLVEIGREEKNEEFNQHLVDTAMVAAAALGRIQAMMQLLKIGADIYAITCLGTAFTAAGHNHRIHRLLHRRDAFLRNSSKNRRWCCDPKRAQRLRYFHREFISQHVLMINAAQKSSTEFRELSIKFEDRRDTWDAGIETVRRLKNGERPTLPGTIAFLCVAKAISETLHNSGSYDYAEPFLQDLVRWQLLFTEGAGRDGYRDAIQSMWGVSLDDIASSKGQVDPDVTERFQELASTLISDASKQFGFHGFNEGGFEQSQQEWQLRNSQSPSDIDFSNDISNIQVSEGSSQVSEIPDTEPPDPDIGSDQNYLRQGIRDDKSAVTDHVVVFLVMGALFAIVLIFLQCKSPRNPEH